MASSCQSRFYILLSLLWPIGWSIWHRYNFNELVAVGEWRGCREDAWFKREDSGSPRITRGARNWARLASRSEHARSPSFKSPSESYLTSCCVRWCLARGEVQVTCGLPCNEATWRRLIIRTARLWALTETVGPSRFKLLPAYMPRPLRRHREVHRARSWLNRSVRVRLIRGSN